ncbi:MAG: DUF721 domain-containing protein [Alloprevotella sp.]|nr:DUF721 domain-containing protein [Alloprevotella sp.]MBR1652604.1 DUF721 domain-containing protein [Alloprevotella sp.]
MKRNAPTMLGDLLSEYLATEGLLTPLNQHRLVEAWPRIAGAAVAEQTTEAYIQGQHLCVHILSPAMRNNLSMQRSALVRRLNAAVGAPVITDIRFV